MCSDGVTVVPAPAAWRFLRGLRRARGIRRRRCGLLRSKRVAMGWAFPPSSSRGCTRGHVRNSEQQRDGVVTCAGTNTYVLGACRGQRPRRARSEPKKRRLEHRLARRALRCLAGCRELDATCFEIPSAACRHRSGGGMPGTKTRRRGPRGGERLLAEAVGARARAALLLAEAQVASPGPLCLLAGECG